MIGKKCIDFHSSGRQQVASLRFDAIVFVKRKIFHNHNRVFLAPKGAHMSCFELPTC